MNPFAVIIIPNRALLRGHVTQKPVEVPVVVLLPSYPDGEVVRLRSVLQANVLSKSVDLLRRVAQLLEAGTRA